MNMYDRMYHIFHKIKMNTPWRRARFRRELKRDLELIQAEEEAIANSRIPQALEALAAVDRGYTKEQAIALVRKRDDCRAAFANWTDPTDRTDTN